MHKFDLDGQEIGYWAIDNVKIEGTWWCLGYRWRWYSRSY
jgi:hypothetical protein